MCLIHVLCDSTLCHVLQIRGEAQAFAIQAKATAEAEQMSKKADAWRDYQEAAMVDMILETLPKVPIFIYFFKNFV